MTGQAVEAELLARGAVRNAGYLDLRWRTQDLRCRADATSDGEVLVVLGTLAPTELPLHELLEAAASAPCGGLCRIGGVLYLRQVLELAAVAPADLPRRLGAVAAAAAALRHPSRAAPHGQHFEDWLE